jgi:hypothetical protein
MLTEALLRRSYYYNPDTGTFFSRKTNKVVKSRSSNGYNSISISGKTYKQHNCAVLYMTGKLPNIPLKQVDHKNGIRNDNRWKNLQVITRRENSFKRVISKNNKTGFRCVRQVKNKARWYAVFNYNYKSIKLPTCDTPEEAYQHWLEKAVSTYGKDFINHYEP